VSVINTSPLPKDVLIAKFHSLPLFLHLFSLPLPHFAAIALQSTFTVLVLSSFVLFGWNFLIFYSASVLLDKDRLGNKGISYTLTPDGCCLPDGLILQPWFLLCYLQYLTGSLSVHECEFELVTTHMQF